MLTLAILPTWLLLTSFLLILSNAAALAYIWPSLAIPAMCPESINILLKDSGHMDTHDVPSAGLPLIGCVVVVAPIFTVEHLDRTPKIHRLQEERSSLFILPLKGNRIVDP
jgi:hypothetical protein